MKIVGLTGTIFIYGYCCFETMLGDYLQLQKTPHINTKISFHRTNKLHSNSKNKSQSFTNIFIRGHSTLIKTFEIRTLLYNT